MKKNPIILPYDGFIDNSEVLRAVASDLSQSDIVELIAAVKFNDIVYGRPYCGANLIAETRFILKTIRPQERLHNKISIFLDLKVADVGGTVKNISRHFYSFHSSIFPSILTVRESLSGTAYLGLRQMLPNTKIALVSVLTDLSEKDCLEQYGFFPEEKILHDMRIVQRRYEQTRTKNDPGFAFDMVVCSPRELNYLCRNETPVFGRKFEKITPGIRDKWMEKGQQVRTMGVGEALEAGADYVVMGSQLQKGNPDKDISPEESRRRTKREIEKILKRN